MSKSEVVTFRTFNGEEIFVICFANRELFELCVDLIIIDEGIFLIVEVIAFGVFACDTRRQCDIAVLRQPNELILR